MHGCRAAFALEFTWYALKCVQACSSSNGCSENLEIAAGIRIVITADKLRRIHRALVSWFLSKG